jgi:aminocarboxymuconate-semialdehyde decarboxylase
MAIDVHCHIVPSGFPELPCNCNPEQWPRMEHREHDQAMVMIGKREFRLVDNRCWDPERRITDMDAGGLDMQVLSPMPELLSYWIDTDSALAMSQHVNRAIGAMIEAAPTRFAGLGMVPLQDPQVAAKELGRFKSEYGLAGIEIGSNILGRSPGDPFFHDFFAEAERLGLAVFVHALHPSATDRLVGPARLAPFVLFPMDVGLAAASVITSGLLDKFPALRVGFSHGGGSLSSYIHRLQNGWNKEKALQSAFGSPLEAARRFYLDNVVFDKRLVRHLIDVFGATQVFIGSDYPFAAGQADSPAMFDGLGLSDKEKACVLYENAQRFLGLSTAA